MPRRLTLLLPVQTCSLLRARGEINHLMADFFVSTCGSFKHHYFADCICFGDDSKLLFLRCYCLAVETMAVEATRT